MTSLLITGGAGYKGALLTESLLKKGYRVTILDNYMYGYESVLGVAAHPSCRCIKKDIRAVDSNDFKGQDIVVHLAGLSGFPACEANPHSARSINVEGTRRLIECLEPRQLLVFASTTSIYGIGDGVVDETTAVKPISLYSQTKLEAEQLCLERQHSIALRFATLFGIGTRMRTDLLPNDLVLRAATDRCMVLFDSKSVRTFLHVRDALRAYNMAVEHPERFTSKLYNVGDVRMNLSKRQIAEVIAKATGAEIIESALGDLDNRNFEVSFDRISALGFEREISIEDGVAELVMLYQWYRPHSPFRSI